MSIASPACVSTGRRSMLDGDIAVAGSGLPAAKRASKSTAASEAIGPRTQPSADRLPVHRSIGKLLTPCRPLATRNRPNFFPLQPCLYEALRRASGK